MLQFALSTSHVLHTKCSFSLFMIYSQSISFMHCQGLMQIEYTKVEFQWKLVWIHICAGWLYCRNVKKKLVIFVSLFQSGINPGWYIWRFPLLLILNSYDQFAVLVKAVSKFRLPCRQFSECLKHVWNVADTFDDFFIVSITLLTKLFPCPWETQDILVSMISSCCLYHCWQSCFPVYKKHMIFQ